MYTPEDFAYDLPQSRIALHPADRRDGAKLLHYRQGSIADHVFGDVTRILPAGSQLILNNTRVIHARLFAYKPTGGRVEIFLLRPENTSVEEAMNAQGACTWRCLVGGAKKWKSGAVSLGDDHFQISAEVVGRDEEEFLVSLKWQPASVAFSEMVEALGKIPLPPYINREAGEADQIRYQTAFAERLGSVAAPTAGLHFTAPILDTLEVELVKLTLHVSAGTFKPISADRIDAHVMHEEQCDVALESIRALARKKRRYAVGTTALRTLESLYWLAEKWKKEGVQPKLIDQYQPYRLEASYDDYEAAMADLAARMEAAGLEQLSFATSIMIAPGYTVRSIHGLFTNFHMPKSTLLLLVHALIGDDWKRVYAHALASDYRFLSYGDSSLLEF